MGHRILSLKKKIHFHFLDKKSIYVAWLADSQVKLPYRVGHDFRHCFQKRNWSEGSNDI